MPLPRTVLSTNFGYTREKQIGFFYHRFGKKTIVPFMTNQVFLPLQWMKLLSLLDHQHKSWNLILESKSRHFMYRFHFQHRNMNHLWTLSFEIYHQQSLVHTVKYSFSKINEKTFYQYVFFCFIRMPKSFLSINMFNTGKTILIESYRGWDLTVLETIQQKLHLSCDEFKNHVPPVHLGFTVESNYLVDFLNSKNKMQFLQS